MTRFGDTLSLAVVAYGLVYSPVAATDEVLFSADGPFQPSWGTSVGTLDIRDSMHYEFDIEIHSFAPTHKWLNILYIGGSNKAKFPSLMIDEQFNFIAGFNDGTGSGVWSSTTYGDGMLEAGNTYHLEFDWDQDWIRGTINGVVAVDKACGAHALMEDQPIYISYPGSWGEADVSVSNILISDRSTADPTAAPTAGPTADPTAAPTAASHHYISRGRSDSPNIDGDVVSYCQDVDNNQAVYWSSRNDFDGNDFGYDIGVRCCKDEDDGTVTGYSPDCDAYPATYDDAVKVCTEDNDYRLCTRDEMESDITEGTGCRFNHVYSWTSDECQSSGCDAASFIDQECTEGANCLLDNGRMSGTCCTSEFLCLEGEGDCDNDGDCAGSLVCGTNNCGSPFSDTHDCCVAQVPGGCDAASFIDQECTEGANCFLDNGRWSGSCCTSEFQCSEGEGDCDDDGDCADSLVCGTNNCGSPFQDTHDCCVVAEVSANAAAAVSGGAAIAEEANETTSADNGFRDWMTTVIGALIGVVVIGAVVVFLMLMAKKRKRAAEEAETEMSKAVPEHVVPVPEMSTSSVAVPATTNGAAVEV